MNTEIKTVNGLKVITVFYVDPPQDWSELFKAVGEKYGLDHEDPNVRFIAEPRADL